MSHPHLHALSSARRFGGAWTDYFPLHAWFDASKAAWADTRHRAVLHHTLGLRLLQEVFGRTAARASDGAPLDVLQVGTQHLEEDCGCVPTLAGWLGARPLEAWIEEGRDEVPHAFRSAERHGGVPEDYAPLHAWMDQGVLAWDDPRAHAPLHSAYGIFLAEGRFGATLVRRSDGARVPTRLVAEGHVLRAHGRIPTVAEWMGGIPRRRWMARAATPLSRVLRPGWPGRGRSLPPTP